MSKALYLGLALIFAAPLFAAAGHDRMGAPAPRSGAGVVQAAPAEGKALTEMVCTQCHELSTDKLVGRTPEAWREIVNKMIEEGAEATEAEAKIIVDYLSKQYPAKM